MINSLDAAKAISKHRGSAIVVATMLANLEWAKVSANPGLDLMFTGAMGKASSVGLGLALARPDEKVIVLDGDGSLLMNLGSLVTVANMAPPNFVHFLFENNIYYISGGQPIPHAGKTNFSGLARAAGYANTRTFSSLKSLENSLETIMSRPGPTFICLKLEPTPPLSGLQPITTRSIISRFTAAMHTTL
jgi:sulfopyruvate decarboxylase subunit beta